MSTISPRDAWTLARLVAGRDVNGQVDDMAQPFKDVAERMATAPVDGPPEGTERTEALAAARKPIMDEWLADRPDRDEMVRALADADPDGPPPEAEDPGGEAGDEWGPIRLGSLPPAPPFPLDVLPIPARELAEAAARSIACPVDFPAVALLASLSGIIGRSAILLVKDGYFASASLFAALVGSPSCGKSPALRAAMAPLWWIGQVLHDRWRDELAGWKATAADERGDEPELRRIATSDTTTEALAPLLAKNPRGLTVAPDEMTKWVMGMDQYRGGKGGDRPFYLSAWGGEPVFIDRAKQMREPIAVPHPFLTVIGGMTPDMLTSLSEGKGREDGFMARVLFSFPERTPRRYSEDGIPEAVADEWRRLALALWDRPLADDGGRPAPRVVRMSGPAAREWAAFCHAHYAEQDADDFPESMEGPWGKLEAYCARLALILHLADLAADPTRAPTEDIPDLTRRAVADAVRLVGYFKGHSRRVYASMGGGDRDGGQDVRALIRWIVRNDKDGFSTRDIGRDFDRFRDDDAALADALDWLARNNIVRPRPEPGAKAGRKPAPSFDVNPAVWESPRFRRFRRNPGP